MLYHIIADLMQKPRRADHYPKADIDYLENLGLLHRYSTEVKGTSMIVFMNPQIHNAKLRTGPADDEAMRLIASHDTQRHKRKKRHMALVYAEQFAKARAA